MHEVRKDKRVSEYNTYYTEFICSSRWQDRDPERCGCGGSGWWLSELDTWHRCPVHATEENARHPEDYDHE